MVANVNRDPEVRAEPFGVDDFTALLAALPRRPAWLDPPPPPVSTWPREEDL